MPIRWRLTLINALTIGAVPLLLGIALFCALWVILPSAVEDNVQARALAAAHAVREGRTVGGSSGRLTLNGIYVIVRSRDGTVLQQTAPLLDRNGRGGEDRIWLRALHTESPQGGEADISPEPPDYVYAVPVEGPGGREVIVEAGKSYEDAREALGMLGVVLAVGILGALFLALVLAYLMARAALSPVDAIVGAARRITESDLSRRLPVTNPKDEMGRLATTINDLLSRLEAAFARREEALAHREEALRRQRRFTADAGHELKTPLTAILGHARMLRRWGMSDPTVAMRGVSAIIREAERMQGIVEELLTLARGDEGAPLRLERVDLSGIVREAFAAARAMDGGEHTLVLELPDGGLEASCDPVRVRQVLEILLDNAIRYTPRGGSVTLRGEEREGLSVIEVSDTGRGIPAEHLPHVFERFYRAEESRSGGGAGLGLSIARQIAEAHRGTLEVESTPGVGSTFTLIIPAS
ncbi:MAG: HAMP domain-containing protein [Rubrobacteraceae bacterium]|nr:HAMP domain-containing protein [Rubrobacteraceae bacterium]